MPLTATWTKIVTSIPLHRSSLALSVVGDKAYIFGGELVPRTPLDNHLFAVDLHDGKVETFTSPSETSEWPSARVGSASAAVGTDIYIWGGRGGKAMTPSSGELYKFDTLAKTFSLVPVAPSLREEQPEDRSFHVLTSYESTLYLHAGCPLKGRLPTLHSLDLLSPTPSWKALPDAPGPGRGGTNLALLQLPGGPTFARFGGFAGVELSDLHLFHPTTSHWSTTTLVPSSPTPSARSVAGFVGLPRPQPLSSHPGAYLVALLFLGEADPTPPEVGHDGAGRFHRDVWGLVSTGTATEEGLEWKEVEVEGERGPEGLGWFGSGTWGAGAVLFGGLEGGNERRGEGWVLKAEEGKK